jgi:outer membrane protein assembly factor BamE (lipoprotein component of BamABCDE complex)
MNSTARERRLGNHMDPRLAKSSSIARIAKLALSVSILALAGCVTQDMNTGQMVPRGQQGMEFSKVEKYAENLKDGMTKVEALLLLGSPAEKDDAGDVWIYLPERYGILIPARALRLEFKNNVLVDHGYRPIILGATL